MKNDNRSAKTSVRIICEFVYLYVRIKKIPIFSNKLYNKKFYLRLYTYVLYN